MPVGFDPTTQRVEYAAGAMLLDPDDPSRVLSRTAEPILAPETDDERAGTVPNVVFPTAIEEVDGRPVRVLRDGRLQDRRGAARPHVTRALGLGIAGAGRFAGFLAGAVADLPGLEVRAVADPDRGRAAILAREHGATASTDWRALLTDDRVDVVAVVAPPDRHAEITLAALAAGRHVLCEKPLATELGTARTVAAAAEASDRVLVVDHVLRYNPLLQALVRLQDELLGPVQVFSFENDASDEDLPAGHWFWDEAVSGGIFVEHGVHFFDAAHLLLGSTPHLVSALAARRPDGTTDLVTASAVHDGGCTGHPYPRLHARRPVRAAAAAPRPRRGRGAGRTATAAISTGA